LDGIAIGILQGLAEWLPISKSFSMLCLVGLKGADPSLAYSRSIWLHLGSFPTPLVVFRRQIAETVRSIRRPQTEGRRLLVFVLGILISGLVRVPLCYLTKDTLAYVDERYFVIALGGLLKYMIGASHSNDLALRFTRHASFSSSILLSTSEA
jgi:undecaprenyl pyrophosphate phosphatase UppP